MDQLADIDMAVETSTLFKDLVEGLANKTQSEEARLSAVNSARKLPARNSAQNWYVLVSETLKDCSPEVAW